eukprot:m.335593 g.335593  ORF g.335593 m.335593 type:complete len:474 (+) comp17633_c0_seq1:121-1542(+)
MGAQAMLRIARKSIPLLGHRVAKSCSVYALPRLARNLHASGPFYKIVQYKLADIGEAIADVELVQWDINVGDEIDEFDQICIVESDKATTPITSRYTGTVTKLYYEEGDRAKTGDPLIDIDVEDEDIIDEEVEEVSSDKEQNVEQESTQIEPQKSERSRAIMTPAVRRLIREHNIELSEVVGTGKDGRILKEDIINLMDSREQDTIAVQKSKSLPPTKPPAAEKGTGQPAAQLPKKVATEDTVVPVKGLQRTMVKSMNLAHQVPTFGYADEINVSNLVTLRSKLNEINASRNSVKLSYLPLMMKAASLALNEYPMLNSHVNEDCTEMVYKGSHNISIAMQTPAGLLVPNVKDCNNKSVIDIAHELNRLKDLGQRGLIGADDLKDGTFSLSNIGTVGGTYMRPILVVPQVVIGALGSFKTRPRYNKDGELVPTEVMEISWTADHRVIDGWTMAQYSNLWKSYLENPEIMLLDMS